VFKQFIMGGGRRGRNPPPIYADIKNFK